MKDQDQAFTVQLLDAVADGVSQSSMLASSLAAKIVADRDLANVVVAKLDPEVLANALAKEMIRLGLSRAPAGQSYRSLLERVEGQASVHLARIMHDELQF